MILHTFVQLLITNTKKSKAASEVSNKLQGKADIK